MNVPLAITQCALLTPLDEDSGGTWQALCAGRRVEDSAAVPERLLDPDTGLDRSIRLALAVARKAVAGQNSADISLFCGTSKGPAETMLRACQRLRRNEALPEIEARQIALGAGAMGAILRERLLIAGPAHTSVAACSSGLHALHRAAAAITRHECQRALVVAADASLHPLFEASFDRLGVIAPRDPAGRRRCEPFDPAGHGFFLVEAAAAILLESAATPPKTPPIAWLDSSAIAADAADLIAIDPHTRSLRRLLRQVRTPVPAFIHAHATGTAHDAYELAAIRDVFGNAVPAIPVFSHKKFLGHSLGAAGLLAVALSALSHHHRRLPTGIPVPAQASSLTIAQGFGGHIAVITLRGN